MAINNGTGAFNVGRDCQVTLIGPFGQVDIPNVTDFMAQQITASVRSDLLNGVQLRAELPKGWSGSFGADRGSAALDTLFNAIEAAWYSSGTIGASTLYQRIVETKGSVTTYQFDNVSLKLDDAGTWKGDAVVSQKVSFEAGRRIAV